MEKKAPMFVKIEEYKDILDILNLVKKKLANSKDLLQKISELKSDEDSELDKWFADLEEIERRVAFVDQNLFEPDEI